MNIFTNLRNDIYTTTFWQLLEQPSLSYIHVFLFSLFFLSLLFLSKRREEKWLSQKLSKTDCTNIIPLQISLIVRKIIIDLKNITNYACTSALGSLAGHNAASASLRRFIWKHDIANKYRDWAICVPSINNKDKMNN